MEHSIEVITHVCTLLRLNH